MPYWLVYINCVEIWYCDSNSRLTGNSASNFAIILKFQDKVGSETKELYEQAFANSIRNYGPDETNTAVDHYNHFNVSLFFIVDLLDKQQIVSTRK
jgi:hypothetical protein